MANDSKNSTSNELIVNQLARLKKIIIIIQVISFLLLIMFWEYLNFQRKESLAIGLTESVTTALMIKDYRRAIETLSPALQNDFQIVQIQEVSKQKTIEIIDNGKNFRQYHFSVPIYSDNQQNNIFAEIQFAYPLFDSLLDWKLYVLIIAMIGTSVFLFRQFKIRFIKEQVLQDKQKEMQVTVDFAKQVSHDIRSPLAALNMTIAGLKDIPEQQRVTLRSSVNRINDIANTLLTNAKANKDQSETKSTTDSTAEANKTLRLDVELLPALIDTLISEKRVQFRDKINVEIDADFKNSYGAFVKINSTEMSRLLSNIVNNSVEAFPNETGKFLLSIYIENQNVVLTAKDNGKGIPAHIMEKLGQMGVSFGKEGTQSGSGLGVYHAKKTIEAFGGQFQISSTPGQGTTITMTLPLAEKPKWFVEKIKITENSQVISLDDDLSIHNIWKGRFQSLNFTNHNINHLTFTSGLEFKDWFGNREISQSKNISSQVYLVDYELINQKQTGLDIIEELGIGPQSILVTSRYEEPAIKQRCERLGVRLTPKAMAGLVPIEIQEPQIKLDAILIDDDELMGYVWRETAKMSNKTFQWFADPKVFIENKNKFDPNTPIYIDVSLANKIKGQDVAIQLHQLGFTNLHLATGYQPDQIEVPSIIKSVIGKDCPL